MEEDWFFPTPTSTDNASANHTMETSDDEADAALRDLIAQRKRLVAALAEAGEMGADFSVSFDNSQQTGDTEPIDESGPSGTAVVKYEAMDSQNIADEIDKDNGFDYYDFDDDEVDKLLEESLATCPAAAPSNAQFPADHSDDRFKGLSQPPAVKSKVVLKHRGMEYFEVLPDGWIEVTHSSGVPVFLHKSTRVCTLSRPYFIGPGSVRNHEVPISAIPCYYQRKVKEIEAEKEKQAEDQKLLLVDCKPTMTPNGTALPNAPKVKVQTVEDFKNRNLNPRQLHEYCAGAFEFETINVMRFKSWSDHRAYRKQQKQQQQFQPTSTPIAANGISTAGAASGRPMLPANVKLITVPDLEKGSKPQQKPFFLNPQGRTSIAVLHEYVQKVMKGSVSYEFTETRNAANPYCATVRIATHDRQRGAGDAGGNKPSEMAWTEYGKGEGNSKKNAKLNAAKQAMRVLVPGIEFNSDGVADQPQQDDASQLFDLIKITDSRVPELSAKAGQPTPFVILQECLKRHSSFGDTTIDMDIQRIKHQQHEFTMKVGKHEVKVQCTNKKEGKQRAAQAMLEKLHPQITTWGSLIRLYGYGAQRKLQENRKEKDSIIRLQVQNRTQNQVSDEPNLAILDKLKQEMLKLYQQQNTPGAPADAAGSSTVSAVKNIDI